MRHIVRTVLMVTSFAAAASSPAWAGDQPGFYAGGGLSAVNTDADKLPPIPALLPGQRPLDENDVGYEAYLGYRLSRYVSVEFGYQDLAEVEKTFDSELVTIPEAPFFNRQQVDIWALSFGGLVSLPLGEHASVFAMGGIGRYQIKDRLINTNLVTPEPRFIGGTDNEYAGWYGVGARLALTERLALRAHWRQSSPGGFDLRQIGAMVEFDF